MVPVGCFNLRLAGFAKVSKKRPSTSDPPSSKKPKPSSSSSVGSSFVPAAGSAANKSEYFEASLTANCLAARTVWLCRGSCQCNIGTMAS